MRDERKELVLRSFEIFSDPRLVDELVHEGWVNHEAAPGRRYGRDGARGSAASLAATFADLQFEPHHMIADGDLVAVHLTLSGRHVGPLDGLPPTGRRFAVRQAHLFRIVDGLLAEHWAVRDDLGLQRQLDGR